MPTEDAQKPWPEDESPYRPVARLTVPAQNAFDPTRADVVDGDFSFSPAHTLAAHRPLGGIDRARLAVYGVMASIHRQEGRRPQTEPTNIDEVPAGAV